MNDIFEELGFELSQNGNATQGEQSFNSPHEAAETLIDLKSDLIEAGFEVQSESIQGNNVVCAFTNEDGNSITVIQNTTALTVSVVSTEAQ